MKPGPKPMPRGQCSAPGCEQIAHHPVAGLCRMHYARVWRHGSPDQTRRNYGTVTVYGYLAVGQGGKKQGEHRLIVEKAIGRPLKWPEEVHHLNENKLDNRPENLVVCPDRAYHKLLHVRQAAFDACGHYDYRKCPFCGKHDDPANMKHNKSSRYFFHRECRNKTRRVTK
jgi:hypothetical protein